MTAARHRGVVADDTRGTSDALPEWLQDVIVHPGAPGTDQIIVIGAEDPQQLGGAIRMTAAIDDWGGETPRPWCALAGSRDAREGLLGFFDYAPGESAPHDEKWQRTLAVLPIDRLSLTVVDVVSTNPDPGGPDEVVVGAHVPAVDGMVVHACSEELSRLGFQCSTAVPDESMLFTDVTYGTGEVVQEQVVGWEDFFTGLLWRYLAAREVLFLRVGADVTTCEASRLRLLLGSPAGARLAVADEEQRWEADSHEVRNISGVCYSD